MLVVGLVPQMLGPQPSQPSLATEGRGGAEKKDCKLAVMRAAAVAVGLLLGACATTSGKLSARFSRERSCPEDQVRVVGTDGVVYRVTGCGQQTEYVCTSFASTDANARNCEERGQARKSDPHADSPRVRGPADPRVIPR